jgi:dipeptidyl aminopeptidase/acylaminoacyl peptidase
MEQALRRAGRPVRALYLDAADHALADGDSRLAWLRALDAFLKTNLGAVGG